MDARGLGSSGIGRYLREIVAGIVADSRFHRITLFGAPERVRDLCGDIGCDENRLSLVRYPGKFYSPLSQLAWAAFAAHGVTRADVAFFPHYDVPLIALPERSVVTVHDLTHFKVPMAFAGWRRHAAGMLLGRSVAGAARVITVSESARRDILERFPWATPKLQVVPNGVSALFQAPADPAAAARRFGIRSPYLLCVGNRKPHKNLVAAVETLVRVQHERPELVLVLVGQAYKGYDQVHRRAEALGVQDAVVELPVVEDETLHGLYAGCEALLFPSLYEGFGLPVLEAMASGAPVIASNRASIPEVAGDAALLVDPDDYAAMASAVCRLQREPDLRDALVRRGWQRAAKFSWASAARQTLEALHEVAELKPAAA